MERVMSTPARARPRPPFKPLTSWSWSAYALYQQCPAKFYYERIAKLPFEKGTALLNGQKVHDDAAAYIRGTRAKLPASLGKFPAEFKRLRTKLKREPASILVEEEWAFTRSWGMTQWRNWSECFLRVKVDVAERDGIDVTITDWKTGRYRPDSKAEYEEQLSLYIPVTLTVLGSLPDIRVTARLVYLDADVIYPLDRAGTARELPAMKKDWERRIKPMFADRTFAPKPNQFCRWCAYRKEAGGPCQF